MAAHSLARSLALCGGALAVIAIAAGRLPGLGREFVVAALAVFAVAAVPLTVLVLCRLDTPRFGAANGVTLLRLALTAMLSGLLLVPVSDAALWLCIGVATVALLLDGVDGKLARRFRQQSRFGARFDMEVDALLIGVLALLAWHFDRAGAWVLAAGLLRYLFVAAALFLPWMRAALPESLRRKTACVAISTALLVCMGPIVPIGLAPWVAAAGVLLLAWSFFVDMLWLYERRAIGMLA